MPNAHIPIRMAAFYFEVTMWLTGGYVLYNMSMHVKTYTRYRLYKYYPMGIAYLL